MSRHNHCRGKSGISLRLVKMARRYTAVAVSTSDLAEMKQTKEKDTKQTIKFKPDEVRAEEVTAKPKLPKVRRKGGHVVRIMNAPVVEDLIKCGTELDPFLVEAMHQMAEGGGHVYPAEPQKVAFCSRMSRSEKYKKRKTSRPVSYESRIDPDALIARTLHRYTCACGKLPQNCPDEILNPEVIRSS